MGYLTIRKYPDIVLRKKCQLLDGVGSSEQKLLDDMAMTMYATRGIGLAAPQVGISKSIAVVDAGKGLIKMINPKVLSKRGSSELEEGCLSVPQKCVNVKRAEEILVSYIDENARKCERSFRGLTARVVQHEIDHLNGKLIIDYLPWYKKMFIKEGD